MSHRLDINQDEKWIMSIQLDDDSVEQLLHYAELLQYRDVEGHDISAITNAIDEKLEEIS